MASSELQRPQALRERLAELTIADEHRLRRRLDRAGSGDARARWEEDVRRAEARSARRRAPVPPVAYPPELPVSARRDDLLAAVRDHQVVVVAGGPGSGRTTQLREIVPAPGAGVRGTIAHTQPRRLAARTVAERIA